MTALGRCSQCPKRWWPIFSTRLCTSWMKKPQPRPRFPQYPQQLGVRNLAILRQHENRAMSENCLLIDDREDFPNKRASCLKMMQTCRHLGYPARSPILPQLNDLEPRQQHLSSHLLYSTMRRCEAALMSFKRVLKAVCVAVLVLLVFVGLGPARWQPRSGSAGRSTTSPAISLSP